MASKMEVLFQYVTFNFPAIAMNFSNERCPASLCSSALTDGRGKNGCGEGNMWI